MIHLILFKCEVIVKALAQSENCPTSLASGYLVTKLRTRCLSQPRERCLMLGPTELKRRCQVIRRFGDFSPSDIWHDSLFAGTSARCCWFAGS